MDNIIYHKESYEIISCCMKVHRELGHGFLEKVYCDALEIELELRNIKYSREHQFKLIYEGITLPTRYLADFTVYNKIILEAKALSEISLKHYGQTINYLKASNYELGLIVNFGSPKLQFKRLLKPQKS